MGSSHCLKVPTFPPELKLPLNIKGHASAVACVSEFACQVSMINRLLKPTRLPGSDPQQTCGETYSDQLHGAPTNSWQFHGPNVFPIYRYDTVNYSQLQSTSQTSMFKWLSRFILSCSSTKVVKMVDRVHLAALCPGRTFLQLGFVPKEVKLHDHLT